MRLLVKHMLAAATGLALLPAAANAGVITENVSFSGNSFQVLGSGVAPVDPVMGSFTITFDPTMSYSDSTSGITLGSLNLILGSPFAFTYYGPGSTPPSGYHVGELVVGGTAGYTAGYESTDLVQYSPATNDFYVQILDFATTPTLNQVGYAQVSAGNNFYYTVNQTGSVSVTPVTPSNQVPEPSTIAVLGAALLGFGWMRYRRQKVQGVPASMT